MKVSIRKRAVVIAVAAGSLLAVPLAMPASAVTPSVTCTKSGSVAKGTKIVSTISGCKPAALAAGGTSATSTPPKGSKKGSVTFTITWKGKGTTVALITFALQPKPGKCTGGTTLVTLAGKVTGGTGAAAKIIKKGEPVSGSLCAIVSGPKTGQTSIEPGTAFKL